MAQEGINATVAGNVEATRSYTAAMLNHPYFEDMTVKDFKVCFTTFANYSTIKQKLYCCAVLAKSRLAQ